MKAFRSRLKQIVAEKHGYLTHEQIASGAGLRRPTVTAWMSDRPFVVLRMDFVSKLADLLECDVEELYEIIETDDEDSHLMAV